MRGKPQGESRVSFRQRVGRDGSMEEAEMRGASASGTEGL